MCLEKDTQGDVLRINKKNTYRIYMIVRSHMFCPECTVARCTRCPQEYEELRVSASFLEIYNEQLKDNSYSTTPACFKELVARNICVCLYDIYARIHTVYYTTRTIETPRKPHSKAGPTVCIYIYSSTKEDVNRNA